MEANKKLQFLGMGAALASYVIFGFTFVFSKQIFNFGISAYAVLTWRMGLALITMLILAVVGVFKIRLKGKRLWRLLPVALCEPCFYFVFESIGIIRTTAAESSVIMALIPIGVLVGARLIFKERTRPLQTAGIIVSVLGVILIVLAKGMSASFSVSGYIFLFLAVAMAVGYSLTVRWVSNEFSSVEITLGTNVVGLCFFFVLACWEGLSQGNFRQMMMMPLTEPTILLNLLFLAIVASNFAFIFMNYSIRVIGMARSSAFVGFNSLTALIFGPVILGERLLPLQFVGAFLIILGVTAANYFTAPANAPQVKERM